MHPYYRPIVQIDAARPVTAQSVAGGWCWFDRVERMHRDGRSDVLPLSDVPDHVISSISAPRAPMAGLRFERPQLMGILNVTPDSFSDGGKHNVPGQALIRAREMMQEGADILDIGGESTRPGAVFVSVEEEIQRTAPVIASIRAAADVPMSIDTRKRAVAAAALQAGANLINDVAAFTHEPALATLAAQQAVPVCLMHAQGDPETMQIAPSYENVLLDVYDFLQDRIEIAVAAGIPKQNIMVDPGIGFGKTQAHNLALLRGISLFHTLGCSILLGASRKGFIGDIGHAVSAEDRAFGSVAVALGAVMQGVQVLRIHDIKETKQALRLAWATLTI